MLQTILLISLVCFICKRNLRYLRYLQQEEYKPSRFIDWLKVNSAYDKRGTFLSSLILVEYFYLTIGEYILAIIILGFLSLAYFENDPRNTGKKKLVLTERAKRIFRLSVLLGISFVVSIYLSGILDRFASFFVLVQSPPFLLILAVVLLSRNENKIQEKFRSEAHNKFVSINPYTIGITGSFGKTSVKNLLGDILSLSLGPTFWPQKGINTEMGIAREIRERMNDYDKYAVIEMGAYHEGSINKLCKFTPIKAGIVTAVHFVHLERFGSVEQVYHAKSELAQNIPSDGILVVNGDNDGARRMASEFSKETTLIYGLKTDRGQLDSVMTNVKTCLDGTSFSVLWKEGKYDGFTKMHGRGALSNILGCFTMACALGAKPELVLAVIRDIDAVSNRLEVKKYDKFIQINDAYNSNPQGFTYALEVLRDLPGERRILLTPGMIELGDKRYEENKNVAKQAAEICDIVIIVNETNHKSLKEGLLDGGFNPDNIKYFSTRDEALAYFQEIRQDNDILLLENDLPDLHEFEERF